MNLRNIMLRMHVSTCLENSRNVYKRNFYLGKPDKTFFNMSSYCKHQIKASALWDAVKSNLH